jgi:hypothetical protein
LWVTEIILLNENPLSAAGEERVDEFVPIAIGIRVSQIGYAGKPQPTCFESLSMTAFFKEFYLST